MSLRPNSLARLAALSALLASATTATAADILVVRSSGPSARSYPPARRLPENARIALKAGDQLMLLDARGTRLLRGPGTFSASGSAGPQIASAQPVQTDRRARIGAVRGVEGGELRPPSLWQVDMTRSGNVCVADPAAIALWRKDAGAALPVTITRVSDGRSRRVAFEAGAASARWPADLPLADGAGYRLAWAGRTRPTTLTFRTLAARPAGLQDMAATLIRNDCAAQLDLLVETVRLPDRAPAG